MAVSQRKVQAFLEKHRIGGLFEDLMSRLIKDLPSEPIPYLVKVLNKMDQSTQEYPDISTRMRPAATPPTGRRSVGGNVQHLSHSADAKAMWASTDSGLKKSDRGYEKPWSTNMKKPKQKREDGVERSRKSEKAELKSSGDFDELFQESQKPKSKTVAFSQGCSGSKQWLTDEDNDLKYTSSTYTRKKVTNFTDDDPLSGELTSDKLEKKYGHKSAEDKRLVSKSKVPSSKRGYAHKEELAALAKELAASNGYLDSGEDSMNADEGDYDSAIDMLEDIDALRSEGVMKVNQTGHKLSRRARVEPLEATVKISICSRCARLAGADSGSEYGGASNPYHSFGGTSDYADSQSGVFQRVNHFTDDEFESVSEVEGPRYPIWDSDEVSMTSRSQKDQNVKSGKQSPISDVIETPHTSLAWESLTQRSETEAALRTSDLTARGRSWHTAPSDDDSSFDWNTDRKGNSTRFTKSGRPSGK